MQRPCLKVVRGWGKAVSPPKVLKEARPAAEQMSGMREGPTDRPVRSLRGVHRIPISGYRQDRASAGLAFRPIFDPRLPMARGVLCASSAPEALLSKSVKDRIESFVTRRAMVSAQSNAGPRTGRAERTWSSVRRTKPLLGCGNRSAHRADLDLEATPRLAAPSRKSPTFGGGDQGVCRNTISPLL